MQTLPSWLTNLSQLDLRGCVNLTDLPATLAVNSWIDLADTQIEWLPVAARSAQLRWCGVPVDERIVFRLETIKVEEVLNERNAERRRVMLKHMGYEAFLEQANAEVLDRDNDPGGERRLLKEQ
ncbi:MAG: Leucine-rich repeat (LRR) protein [Chloroflexi bacterium AL-W]|nr:Leucine-rich repeat (LRR) protein [Chloroflexi bacterium AL-N1]NOK69359.1 Leucine-rich repeat (LRR) protein [Chloroflexi bacterium AL-N10]NOK76420.1 Leucine-rich repeat (LRR) protein [Chloroflexi bacterium AL-N5]NOK83537.1 Leucine-rich repeat (LRR) protein [Chloroflexi bacterium AL-W]NOK91197.1 Leucine-rich repeat (LRR) protein [Chloroflexi bacterium AL-N15]